MLGKSQGSLQPSLNRPIESHWKKKKKKTLQFASLAEGETLNNADALYYSIMQYKYSIKYSITWEGG